MHHPFFQFVNFHETLQTKHDPEGSFALAALMEVPSQLTTMLELGYFNNNHQTKYESGEKRTSLNNTTLEENIEEIGAITKKQNVHSINNDHVSNSLCQQHCENDNLKKQGIWKGKLPENKDNL